MSGPRKRQDRKGEGFDQQEAQRRFEAALRGARLAGPKPLKDAPKKREKGQGRASDALLKKRDDWVEP